jgi:hypothetical protein
MYETTGNRASHTNYGSDDALRWDTIKEIVELYKPKRMLIDHNDSVVMNCDAYKHASTVSYPNHMSSIMSMHYSIKQANMLKFIEEREGLFVYDAVIRCRYDDLIQEFDFDFEAIQENVLYVPTIEGYGFDSKSNGGYSWGGGINDQFAIGTSATMDHYSNLVDHINEYCDKGGRFQAEQFLRHHMETIGGYKQELVDGIKFILKRQDNVNGKEDVFEKVARTYEEQRRIKSNINEHLPSLYRLALQCDHITTLVASKDIAISAFMASNPSNLNIHYIHEHIPQSESHPSIQETDLLFVSSSSPDLMYLTIIEKQVKKYLAFHNFIPSDVEYFLSICKCWKVKLNFKNSGGLFVLERIS